MPDDPKGLTERSDDRALALCAPFSNLSSVWRHVTGNDAAQVLLLIGLLLVSILLIHPVVEMGFNDDWSYTRTALELARQGHPVYNGWSAPTVGVQAYWAALFIKLFGFSFTIVRLSTVVLAVLCIPVLYAVGRSVGLSPSFTSFSVLATILSPVVLPGAMSFMTDVPAFFFFALCLLASLRAWNATDVRRLMAWATAALIAGILAGSVRQVYWPAPVLFLLVLAWRRRRERLNVVFLLSGSLVAVLIAISVVLWFKNQPYTVTDIVFLKDRPIREVASSIRHSLIVFADTAVLLLLPVLVIYAAASRRVFSRKVWILGALAILSLAWFIERAPYRRPPRLGNTVTEYGYLRLGENVIGDKPLVLSPRVRGFLGVAMLTSAAAHIAILVRVCHLRMLDRRKLSTLLPFLCFAGPFAAAVLLLLVVQAATGASFFDRYLIPMLPIVAIPSLWLYQRTLNDGIPVIGWAAMLVFSLFAIGATHDAFAINRARWRATEALTRSAVPRKEILAGIEYDAWTEVDLVGHVNTPRIHPASAYHPITDCTAPEVNYWFRTFAPNVQPRYFLVLNRLPHLVDASFPPVPYQTWLPPSRRYVFTQMLPDARTISCR